ncbi:hypothetical protein AAC387_Pa03g0551 [Persea americana]
MISFEPNPQTDDSAFRRKLMVAVLHPRPGPPTIGKSQLQTNDSAFRRKLMVAVLHPRPSPPTVGKSQLPTNVL